MLLERTAVESMADAELPAAIVLLSAESEKREKGRPRHEKAEPSKRNKGDPRCPECKARLMRDGRRRGGVRPYRRPKRGRRCSDASNASLSSSKLTPSKIRSILTMMAMDCPGWAIAEIADANPKTAQPWFDRCLDAATERSMGSRLSGRVWIDGMGFAPTRASGLADGVWATYAGKIARDACVEAAFDPSRRAFCRLYSGKLGFPTKAMAADRLSGRMEPKSLPTHGVAGSTTA